MISDSGGDDADDSFTVYPFCFCGILVRLVAVGDHERAKVFSSSFRRTRGEGGEKKIRVDSENRQGPPSSIPRPSSDGRLNGEPLPPSPFRPNKINFRPLEFAVDKVLLYVACGMLYLGGGGGGGGGGVSVGFL